MNHNRRLSYSRSSWLEVAFVEMRMRMLLVGVMLVPTICLGSETITTGTKVLVDFKSAKEKKQWMIVNDGVMGGLSKSGIEITSSTRAVFQGRISLDNNGGFASVRRQPEDYKLSGYDGVILRVKGDGRTYQFRVRTNDRFDGVAYKAEIKTKRGKWITIKVPFKSMKPTFRGRVVPDYAPLRPESIRQIGFLIGDKREGPFLIEIDYIKAYRLQDQGNPSEQSRFLKDVR